MSYGILDPLGAHLGVPTAGLDDLKQVSPALGGPDAEHHPPRVVTELPTQESYRTKQGKKRDNQTHKAER